MKHFGTDIIKSLQLYQSAGQRTFCHTCHTILCLLDGTLTVRTRDREDLFRSQGVLLIPSGRQVSLLSSEPASYLVLQLSPVFLMEAFSRDRLLTEVLSSQDLLQLHEILPELLGLIPFYLESPDRNRLDINRILFAILRDLDKVLAVGSPDPETADTTPGSRQDSVDTYIMENIEKQISLQDTASVCGLTPQYLSSFFQKSMNCTFMEYVNRIKAEKAYEWLLCSEISADEVCDIAGFKTYSAFCKSIEARYGCSWDELRLAHAVPAQELPAEDVISSPSSMLYTAVSPAEEDSTSLEPTVRIRRESVDAETVSGNVTPDSWRTILNIGSAGSLFFDPFLRLLGDFNRSISFKYCRMYDLLQLVTVYVSGGRTYYGFEFVFQNLDYIINADLIPFLDLGYRDYPGHVNLIRTFAFNSDTIDVYYEKLQLILPEFLRAASNRYGADSVKQWGFEFHFSYQNNRNYTFWQFLSSFRKIIEAARSVLPDVHIGGLGFDAALHPGTLQSMLEQLKSLDCRLDFVSMHVNGLILPQINGSGSYRFTTDENEVNRRVDDAVALIRRFYSAEPLYITEFGFAHFLRTALNDSLFQASFILRFLSSNVRKVQGIGYHMFDDLGELERPVEQEFFGSPGVYSAHGLRKPSYYAFFFLSQLGKSLLSSGTSYIITANSRYNYQILAFHYRHITKPLEQLHEDRDVLAFEKWCATDGDRLQLHFQIRGAASGDYLVKSLRIRPGAGNLHKLWLEHPSSLSDLNESDYGFFREYAFPDVAAQPCSVPASGELTLDIMLAPLEIVLLIIDHKAI